MESYRSYNNIVGGCWVMLQRRYFEIMWLCIYERKELPLVFLASDWSTEFLASDRGPSFSNEVSITLSIISSPRLSFLSYNYSTPSSEIVQIILPNLR